MRDSRADYWWRVVFGFGGVTLAAMLWVAFRGGLKALLSPAFPMLVAVLWAILICGLVLEALVKFFRMR